MCSRRIGGLERLVTKRGYFLRIIWWKNEIRGMHCELDGKEFGFAELVSICTFVVRLDH